MGVAVADETTSMRGGRRVRCGLHAVPAAAAAGLKPLQRD